MKKALIFAAALSATAPNLEAIAAPVKGEKAPKAHLQNEFENNKLRVFYLTHSWALYDNDNRDITAFKKKKKPGSIIIEGYADHRGGDDFNLEISKSRAQGVEARLRAIGYQGSIEVIAYGEGKSSGKTKEEMKRDRRVTLVANESPLTRALTELRGDVYLIDATGSMQGRNWQTVNTHKFPEKSEIYTFNSCTGLTRVKSLSEIIPDCGTPLWDSAGSLIKDMTNGKTLTILSDGGDNESRGYNTTSIINLARSKGIKVSTIGIGVDHYTKQQLVTVASQTNGKFYVSN
ncbi:OmpA family protein [Candidatus Woesearchaeota archaeon]|nr:OmpA family protein [Candidatus Woesearchaeota archaeon]